MTYECISLDELMAGSEESYWESLDAKLDQTGPYRFWVRDRLKAASGGILVAEIAEGDPWADHKKGRLFREIDMWIRDGEEPFNAEMEAIKAKDAGSSTTKTRFNDTPQSKGDYSAAAYTSTVTVATTEGTLSSEQRLRLAENVWGRAMAEFRRRFEIHES